MKPESLQSCPACTASAFRLADPIAGICLCRNCGFLFDNPRPAPDDIAAFYSTADKYENWLAHEAPRDGLWQRRLASMLRAGAKGSLLDVGTGTGQFLAHARKDFSPVKGTEVSASGSAIAREKYGLDVIQQPLESLVNNGGTWDTITLFHVLEHVPDPLATLAACARLLSPQGMLCIAVPNEIHGLRPRLRGGVKFLLGRLGVSRFAQCGVYGLPRLALDGTQHEIHLGHFTAASLGALVTRCGFTVMQTGLDPFFVSTGMRLVAETFWFRVCSAVYRITKVNVYDTLWVAARKT